MNRIILFFALFFLFYNCHHGPNVDKIKLEMDSVINDSNAKPKLYLCDTTFKSTVDTILFDTLVFDNFKLIIESIKDSLFKKLFCDFSSSNDKIDNIYFGTFNNQYDKIVKIDKSQIEKYSDIVTRHDDTLYLKMENNEIVYNNIIEEWGGGTSYFYLTYLNGFKSHIVHFRGYESIGTILISENNSDEYIGRNIIIYNDKMITNEFFGNEMDGGWFNEFKIFELKNGVLEKNVDIDFPINVQNNYETWGIRNPLWISNDELIFEYYIGQMKPYEFTYEHFYAKMKIVKVSS